MKKFLLLAAVALVVSTAGAQMKNKTECIAEGIVVPGVVEQPRAKSLQSSIATSRKALGPVGHHSQLRQVKTPDISTMQEMKMGGPSSRVTSAPKATRNRGLLPIYHRPAGMYSATFFALDGAGLYNMSDFIPILMAKPYATYTWEGTTLDASGWANFAWDFWKDSDVHYVDYQSSISFSIADTAVTVPIFYAVDGRLDDDNAIWYDYQIRSNYYDYYADTIIDSTPGFILSAENDQAVSRLMGNDFIPLYSSKTMLLNHQGYVLTRFYGADPWGENEYGWWFGKNASHVDGMAQAFEKPQHPYLLKKVYLQSGYDMVVNAPVTMTCKVYKLNGIPNYIENDYVTLPEEPGELICTGEALVTPTTGDEKNGLIEFNLYGHDEYDPNLTYELCPTVDYPILVCIDGYNDAGMENLVNFSAYVSYNYEVDEGYGELTYLKRGLFDPVYNEQGDTIDQQFNGEYDWVGVNNFFGVEMKTGVTIFIGTENPYIIYENEQEDGEHFFPTYGGTLKNSWADGSVTVGIKFLSSCPAWDDDWVLTYNGSEDLPDWLTIELNDNSVEDESPYYVTANVIAQPLPNGVNYREAVIRFEIPGAYIDYKFMQGTQSLGMRGDVNVDGNVSIGDVTALIDILLNGASGGPTADVNADGHVTIADVTKLIDMLLSGEEPALIVGGTKTIYVNGVAFNMVAVEGGTFAMGATRNQLGSSSNSMERPVHLVTLSDYYIGQTEVTQDLWVAVMGSNPSNFTGDLKRPVEMVSWNQCQQFITQLNQLTGMNFRMPTEAEWEFAARGGVKNGGNRYAGSNNVDDVAWYSGNAGGTTHPVATKAPNELGIFDMSGNIYEYCLDMSSGTPNYPSEPQINPTGPDTGTTRIIRGGSIDWDSDYCRAARRWSDAPDSKWKDQGLRLAL